LARRWGEARSRVPARQCDALENAQRNSIFFVADAVIPPGRESSRGRSDWIPMVGVAASEAGYSGLQARDDAGDSAHNIWSGDSASVRVVVRVRMPKPLPLLSHHTTTTSSSTNKQGCAPAYHCVSRQAEMRRCCACSRRGASSSPLGVTRSLTNPQHRCSGTPAAYALSRKKHRCTSPLHPQSKE